MEGLRGKDGVSEGIARGREGKERDGKGSVEKIGKEWEGRGRVKNRRGKD